MLYINIRGPRKGPVLENFLWGSWKGPGFFCQ